MNAETEPETRALVALGRVLIALRFLTPQEIRRTLVRAEALARTYGPPKKRPNLARFVRQRIDLNVSSGTETAAPAADPQPPGTASSTTTTQACSNKKEL